MHTFPLTKIRIFPIKSLNGIDVDKSKINQSGGLNLDRQWALKLENGRFLNGKNDKGIHQVKNTYDLDEMSIALSFKDKFRETFSLLDNSVKIENWFSQIFNQRISLVRTNTHFSDDQNSPGPTLISTATLEEVGKWFELTDIAELRRRFRTNLEISGCPPFWEDTLVSNKRRFFLLGEFRFSADNLCKRCVVPTRNPDSGEANAEFMKAFILNRSRSYPPELKDHFQEHFYRLAVNTSVISLPKSGTIKVGDVIQPVTVNPV